MQYAVCNGTRARAHTVIDSILAFGSVCLASILIIIRTYKYLLKLGITENATTNLGKK